MSNKSIMLINQRNTIMSHPIMQLIEMLPEDKQEEMRAMLFERMIDVAIEKYHVMEVHEKEELKSNLEDMICDLGSQITKAQQKHSFIVNSLLEMEKKDGENRAQ